MAFVRPEYTMNSSVIVTVLVPIAFTALLVWVLRPLNKKRLESYGSIPLDEDRDDTDIKDER